MSGFSLSKQSSRESSKRDMLIKRASGFRLDKDPVERLSSITTSYPL